MAKERKASVIYEGNASQLVYAFPFDYLRKKFVKVEDIYTNITELTMGVDYTVEDKQVRLVKGIPLGHSVKIYRETTTAPLVEWQDASVLRSADLSLQEVQLLHLAEETADKVFDSGMSTAYDNPNCWDGQYKRIINALDPIEDGDVVTLRYIKSNQDSLLNQLKNTGATQNSSIVATGDSQNARLDATGDTQNKRLTDTGNAYVSTMTTLKDTATIKANDASTSAELSKKWAVSASSPDGATDSKSSKTWAETAKTSAVHAYTSEKNASTYADKANTYLAQATNKAQFAETKATAAEKSATAAATSASNAATSATNAKTSETKAASSASAAAQSAENAKTWDPTNYTKTIMITKPDNGGHRVLKLLEEITDYDKYNYHRCGGSFSIYPYVRAGGNSHLEFPPVYCAISLPYNLATNDGYTNWSTNSRYIPLVVRNNTTNKVYWGISIAGSGHTVKMFGSFEHNISVIDTLLSASDNDVYDGYTILHKADVITPAKASDIPTALSQLTNDSNYVTSNDVGLAVAAEAKKWKDAYNNLRKRSTPAQFDDAELTELMLGAVGSGNITLLQPYTDFDGLLIDYTGDNGNFLSSAYISTAELNRRMAVAKSVDATVIFLFEARYFWTIFITEAKKFSPTYFPYEDDNCVIQQIYGVKFKEIT